MLDRSDDINILNQTRGRACLHAVWVSNPIIFNNAIFAKMYARGIYAINHFECNIYTYEQLNILSCARAWAIAWWADEILQLNILINLTTFNVYCLFRRLVDQTADARHARARWRSAHPPSSNTFVVELGGGAEMGARLIIHYLDDWLKT